MCIRDRSVDIGTYEILIGEADARQAVRKTEFRTDVIGSNTRLAGASLEMIDLPGRESRLRKALASIQQDYDFIFIDCPPSLDLLTLNGLCACDSILIPVQCEYYALEGLSELVSTLKTVRKKYNAYLDIEGVVFTMFSVRYNPVSYTHLDVYKRQGKGRALSPCREDPRIKCKSGTLPDSPAVCRFFAQHISFFGGSW